MGQSFKIFDNTYISRSSCFYQTCQIFPFCILPNVTTDCIGVPVKFNSFIKYLISNRLYKLKPSLDWINACMPLLQTSVIAALHVCSVNTHVLPTRSRIMSSTTGVKVRLPYLIRFIYHYPGRLN